MAVVKMKLVNFIGNINYIDEFVSKYLIDSEGLQPEYSLSVLDNVTGLSPFTGDNPCGDQKRRCKDLMKNMGIKPITQNTKYQPSVTNFDIDNINNELKETENAFSQYKSQINKLEDRNNELNQVKKQLDLLGDLDVDLQNFFDLRFFKFRFGRLPMHNYDRLKMYANDLEAIIIPVNRQDEDDWLIYITPAEFETKVDGIFNSLHFERSRITGEFNGTPSEIRSKINEQISDNESEIWQIKKNIDEFSVESATKLQAIYDSILDKEKVLDIRKFAAHTNDSFYIVGWMPEKALNKIKPLIDQDDSVISVVVDSNQSVVSKPPTQLKNFFLFRPFEVLVKMYGLPAYEELDPTPFIAVAYFLMCGMMFGDVGQGFLIAILGFVLMRRKVSIGGVMLGAGISAGIFGFLYGSIFGFEDIIHPLLISPMDNINTIYNMLIASIVFGVILLIISMSLNIVNAVKSKDLGRALFDRNGVAGMVFYLLIISAVAYFALKGKLFASITVLLVCLLIPFLIIFFRHPLENIIKKKDHILPQNGFWVETIFEMVDMLLSFASNTISFVRLSAFAINHIGLSMAFFILADMAGPVKPLIILIGNLLIMGLEGLIVSIQGLRLTYYELFSRFFKGDGRPYIPLGQSKNE